MLSSALGLKCVESENFMSIYTGCKEVCDEAQGRGLMWLTVGLWKDGLRSVAFKGHISFCRIWRME